MGVGHLAQDLKITADSGSYQRFLSADDIDWDTAITISFFLNVLCFQTRGGDKINAYLSWYYPETFHGNKKGYKDFETSFSNSFNSACIYYEELVRVMLEAKKSFSSQAKDSR